MALATITTKGRVTIPTSVRDSLMLSPRNKIEFVVTDKREALIRPISKKVNEVFGILHKPGRKIVSLEEMDANIRQRMKALDRNLPRAMLADIVVRRRI